MAAPRKEARVFLDDAEHARLKYVADRAGLSVAEHLEKLIQADNASKIDKVVDDYHALVRAGIVGKSPEKPGEPRK